MREDVTVVRLYVLRSMYLLNVVLVGSGVVVEFLQRRQPWDQITGAAFSFWAALAVLSLLGIRYPLAMLPLLFVQLLYKAFWFLIAYIPLRAAGGSSDLALGFAIAIVLDIVVIPWPYVLVHYIREPSDRWKQSRLVSSGMST